MLGVTIRINAATDRVTTGDQVFDRSRMTKREKNRLRRILVGAFETNQKKKD